MIILTGPGRLSVSFVNWPSGATQPDPSPSFQ